jgi:hypothetical protein
MLRDSVPSLCVMDKHNPYGGDFTEDLQGLPLVQKLNKVFICHDITLSRGCLIAGLPLV